MTFPSITAAQIVAALFVGIPHFLVLFGVDLDPDQRLALDNLRDIGLGLFGADALIRGARNLGNKAPSIDQVIEEDDGNPVLPPRAA